LTILRTANKSKSRCPQKTPNGCLKNPCRKKPANPVKMNGWPIKKGNCMSQSPFLPIMLTGISVGTDELLLFFARVPLRSKSSA
jgi:hypothetical protein